MTVTEPLLPRGALCACGTWQPGDDHTCSTCACGTWLDAAGTCPTCLAWAMTTMNRTGTRYDLLAQPAPDDDLTPDRDEAIPTVHDLTRRGLSARQIAEQLHIAERTVVRRRRRGVAA